MDESRQGRQARGDEEGIGEVAADGEQGGSGGDEEEQIGLGSVPPPGFGEGLGGGVCVDAKVSCLVPPPRFGEGVRGRGLGPCPRRISSSASRCRPTSTNSPNNSDEK